MLAQPGTLIFLKKIKKQNSKTNATLKWVNPFVPNAPFLYPLKTSENLVIIIIITIVIIFIYNWYNVVK